MSEKSVWPAGATLDAADSQALLVSGFAKLPYALALMVDFGTASAAGLQQWLGDLAGQITTIQPDPQRAQSAAVQLLLSAEALKRLRPDSLGTSSGAFSAAFREGMTERWRNRMLGDASEGPLAWRGTVPGDDPMPGVPAYPAIVLLYAADCQALADARAALPPLPAGASVARDIALDIGLQPSPTGAAPMYREHFGFADSISQPLLYARQAYLQRVATGDWHAVAAGDVVLGEPDAFGAHATGPLLADAGDGRCLPPPWPALPGLHGMGLGGSYVVVRELLQDVPGFRADMDKAAATPGLALTADALAETLMGRTRDGEVRCPVAGGGGATLRAGNDFGFVGPQAADSAPGSHVRRANPRDGGLPPGRSEADRRDLLKSTNSHRILRRGRNFGRSLAPDEAPEPGDGPRGMLFMALNADIPRQFETIMRSWLRDPGFAALQGETDPLFGDTLFRVPAEPAAITVKFERHVRLAGGDYYFLPALSTIRFLAGMMRPLPPLRRFAAAAPLPINRGEELVLWLLRSRRLLGVLRRFSPVIPLPGNRRLVLRAEAVRGLLLDHDNLEGPYQQRQDVILDHEPFMLTLNDGQNFRRRWQALLPDGPLLDQLAADAGVLAGDWVRQRHGGDIVQLCQDVTIDVMCRHLGIPHHPALALWMLRLFEYQFGGKAIDGIAAIAADCRALIGDEIAWRRQSGVFGQDLMGRAMQAGSADDREIRTTLLGLALASSPQLAIAGAAAIAGLVRRPDVLKHAQAAAAGAEPAQLWPWLRESLRFDPLAPVIPRAAHRDTCITLANGTQIDVKAGQTMLLSLTSAMFDGLPGDYDANLPRAAYLHFGHGVHECFAAALVEKLLPAILAPLLSAPHLQAPASGLIRRGLHPLAYPARWSAAGVG